MTCDIKYLIYFTIFTYTQYYVCGRSPYIFGQHNVPILNKIMVDIINSCYADYSYIFLVDESKEDITKLIWSWRPINIVASSDYTRFKAGVIGTKNRPGEKSSKKIDSFFFIVNSETHFKQTLKILKQTKNLNNLTPIFMTSSLPNGCNKRENFFKAMWKKSYLMSYFLCLDEISNPSLYTYNPYTNRVPAYWEVAGKNTSNTGDWTLLKRLNSKDNLCEDLSFDRTKYLDGTEIRFVLTNNKIRIPQGDDELIKLIKNAVESSLNISFIENQRIFKSPKRTINFKESLTKKETDIDFTLDDKTYKQFYHITYPIIYTENYVLTHSHHLSIIEKTFNFYGMLSIIATLVILIITFFVILLREKRSRIVFAAFEVLRLLINKPLYTKINISSLKIFFATMFFYFLIMHGTFHGNLAQLFIKSEFKTNVDSLEDLITLKKDDSISMRFYNHDKLPEVLKNLGVRNLLSCKNDDCIYNLLYDTDSALIEDYTLAMKDAVQYNLYLSKNPVGSTKQFYFYTRKNWPLAQRVNHVFMQLQNSGLTKKWCAKLVPDKVTYQHMMLERLKPSSNPITINMLMFAFQFLAFGYTCALVCFIMEKRFKPLPSFCQKWPSFMRNIQRKKSIISKLIIQKNEI